MIIIDTHAHYDEEAFDTDREELLASLPEAGISFVVNVGASPEGVRDSVELSRRYPHVYAAVGIHPDHVGDMSEETLDWLEGLASDPKTVAIGEIGLDYHWDVWPREIQKLWFARQMELAVKTGLPINVHSREAAQDTFDLVRSVHAGSTGGIIHCYSGSAEMAQEYVSMGYHIGIGGVITFRNGKTLKRVVETLPLSALVTETDCPYLAPSPHRGERNSSLLIPLMIEEIARIKQMDVEETAQILYENALRVYGKIIESESHD